MLPNFKPSERVAIAGVINPQSASAAQSTGWVDATKFHNIMAAVFAGDIGNGANVNAKLEQATSAGGAGAKDVPALAIAQLTNSGGDDNKQTLINVRQTDLDFNNGFTFVRLTITPSAASLIAGALLGLDPRYGVASDNDAASVDEIVG